MLSSHMNKTNAVKGLICVGAVTGILKLMHSWVRKSLTERTPGPQPLSECDPARLAHVGLFCSDMDGTWLGPDHRPTAGGLCAVQEAERAEVTWVFATGRCLKSAEDASGLPLRGRPGIYSNGSLVLGAEGKELYTLDLPDAVVTELQKLAEDLQVAMLACDRDRFVVLDPQNPMALHLHEVYGDPCPEAWDRSDPLPKAQLVHMVAPSHVIDQLIPRAEAAVGHLAAVARNLPTDLTISCANANKGFASAQLRAHLGISGTVLGIGDSGNDVAMLGQVDVPIAMANASPAPKIAAEFLTRANNSDSECPGVLEVVRAVVEAKNLHNRL